MAAIAAGAGINLDTIYACVGRKPQLFRLLIETAISGGDEAQPIAEEREYVRAVRAAPTAREKLDLYAGAVAAMAPRLAPLVRTLREASRGEPGLEAMWRGITKRRADNMLRLAVEPREIVDTLDR